MIFLLLLRHTAKLAAAYDVQTTALHGEEAREESSSSLLSAPVAACASDYEYLGTMRYDDEDNIGNGDSGVAVAVGTKTRNRHRRRRNLRRKQTVSRSFRRREEEEEDDSRRNTTAGPPPIEIVRQDGSTVDFHIFKNSTFFAMPLATAASNGRSNSNALIRRRSIQRKPTVIFAAFSIDAFGSDTCVSTSSSSSSLGAAGVGNRNNSGNPSAHSIRMIAYCGDGNSSFALVRVYARFDNATTDNTNIDDHELNSAPTTKMIPECCYGADSSSSSSSSVVVQFVFKLMCSPTCGDDPIEHNEGETFMTNLRKENRIGGRIPGAGGFKNLASKVRGRKAGSFPNINDLFVSGSSSKVGRDFAKRQQQAINNAAEAKTTAAAVPPKKVTDFKWATTSSSSASFPNRVTDFKWIRKSPGVDPAVPKRAIDDFGKKADDAVGAGVVADEASATVNSPHRRCLSGKTGGTSKLCLDDKVGWDTISAKAWDANWEEDAASDVSSVASDIAVVDDVTAAAFDDIARAVADNTAGAGTLDNTAGVLGMDVETLKDTDVVTVPFGGVGTADNTAAIAAWHESWDDSASSVTSDSSAASNAATNLAVTGSTSSVFSSAAADGPPLPFPPPPDGGAPLRPDWFASLTDRSGAIDGTTAALPPPPPPNPFVDDTAALANRAADGVGNAEDTAAAVHGTWHGAWEAAWDAASEAASIVAATVADSIGAGGGTSADDITAAVAGTVGDDIAGSSIADDASSSVAAGAAARLHSLMDDATVLSNRAGTLSDRATALAERANDAANRATEAANLATLSEQNAVNRANRAFASKDIFDQVRERLVAAKAAEQAGVYRDRAQVHADAAAMYAKRAKQCTERAAKYTKQAAAAKRGRGQRPIPSRQYNTPTYNAVASIAASSAEVASAAAVRANAAAHHAAAVASAAAAGNPLIRV